VSPEISPVAGERVIGQPFSQDRR